MELNTPQDYIEVAMRRKWWIIIPLVLVMMAGYGVYTRLPRIYRATTLILAQPQKTPEGYVQPTVTLSIADWLPTLSEHILSRTILEKVVSQLHLVDNLSDPLVIDKKVNSLRKTVEIEVLEPEGRRKGTSSTFAISLEDDNPVNAAQIVNKIASLFIAESLKERENQAHATSQLLEKQLSEVERELEEKQVAIRRFKERHMGELPVQQDANLRIFEGLQQELQTNSQSFIAAQQRKANLEIQVDQLRRAMALSTNGGAMSGDPLLIQLKNQRLELQELETQYTDVHPDVIAAKASIKKLEAQIRERDRELGQAAEETNSLLNPTLGGLNQELREVRDQIHRLNLSQADLKNRIARYQRRIEIAPQREEEMATLLRDYNHLQENYQSLWEKRIQAQLAENLERRQKEDQFRILDPATPPTHPVKPKPRQVFGLAFILGLGFGGALALTREHQDRSFYRGEDVERFTGFPIVASIPSFRTQARRTGRS